MGTQVAWEAMPALPGAQKICPTLDERLRASTMACSLPPEPITRTFFIRINA